LLIKLLSAFCVGGGFRLPIEEDGHAAWPNRYGEILSSTYTKLKAAISIDFSRRTPLALPFAPPPVLSFSPYSASQLRSLFLRRSALIELAN